MEHFYILVTGADIERDEAAPPPSVHSSTSSRHLPSRSPPSSTRSSRGQPASAASSDERAFFGPPGLSQLVGPPSGAAFGGSSRAESGASAALSSLLSSVAGPGGALSGSGGMPPLVPMTATRIFSSLPLGPSEAHSSAAAGEASSASHSASSSTTRPSRAAGTGALEARGSLGVNPLLEEILQRTFSHVSAETFISEFVRRTIDNQRRGNPPASQFAIDNLQEVPAEGSDDCCTVCQDEIEEGTQKLRMPCAHSFHRQCLLRWLAEHNTCPICRCEIESHCARYNQANFDKLKGKLHCKTMSNHEDPSKMEPPPTPDFLFGGAGGALGGPSTASRTLRMTLRMPAGTLSWLGTEMPSSTGARRGAPAGAQSAPSHGFGRRSQSARGRPRAAAGAGADASQDGRRPVRAGAAAEPSVAASAAASPSASSASAEAPPRAPPRGLPPNWSVLRPFVAALEEAERGLLLEREGEAGEAREGRETRPRSAPIPSPGRQGEGRKRRRGADAEGAGGSGAAAQEREAERDGDGDEPPVAARTRQRQR